jgi:hypothetical protein
VATQQPGGPVLGKAYPAAQLQAAPASSHWMLRGLGPHLHPSVPHTGVKLKQEDLGGESNQKSFPPKHSRKMPSASHNGK